MTQEDKIIRQLNRYGYVSRNWALKNYISRLSAYIYDFRKRGLKIEGEWTKTKYGNDYIYKLK